MTRPAWFLAYIGTVVATGAVVLAVAGVVSGEAVTGLLGSVLGLGAGVPLGQQMKGRSS